MSERTGVDIDLTVISGSAEPVLPDASPDSTVIIAPAPVAPVAPIVNAPATLRRRDLRAAAKVAENREAFRRAAGPAVTVDRSAVGAVVEAVVVDPPGGDTGPNAPVDGGLDWLAPSGERLPGPAAAVDAATARLASLRRAASTPEVRRLAVTRWLPQAGVVAVMAAATVGNSLAGPFSPQAPRIQSAFAPQREGIPVDLDAPGAPVVSDLDLASDMVPDADGLLRVRGSEEASRSSERLLLPNCDGVPPEIPLTNGSVPDEYLCVLPNGRDRLRADAAVAFALLNQAFAAHFGRDLVITSGYRTYEEQAALRRQKPGLAAKPGESEHGFGLAVDLGGTVNTAGEEYWWLRENALRFGFDNPTWARKGGGKYEPWHWEYVNGTS